MFVKLRAFHVGNHVSRNKGKVNLKLTNEMKPMKGCQWKYDG